MTGTYKKTDPDSINEFIRQVYGESPSERLDYLEGGFMESPEEFDPDEISWICNRIGVTNLVGAFIAADRGHFIINTAEEINSPCDLKMPVDPRVGPAALRKTLDQIAEQIDNTLETTNKKVVVHCYMGMERSVLSVAWYLNRYRGKSIDEAYRIVANVRPIAIDHRSWITD